MSNSNKQPTIKPLTVLHTSDWHLDRRLYGNMRYDEFEAFLAWLTQTIEEHKVDVLIVAGDIFDTMTPSNRAQSLYYQFLGTVSSLYCDHVVIVSGNHDSPTFLDAPASILKFLNVHVIGTACEQLADEVIVLNDKNGQPQCLIAAVPYLRDRDVRSSQAGESAEDKDNNVISGIKQHYAQVADIAKAKQKQLIEQYNYYLPIIATGHLFTAGGKTTEDDGVRELYIGSLGRVSVDMFDDCFDYVALGHLHVPQKVGGCEHIRYSGSPIAMGFGEARQQKQVLLIQFAEAIREPVGSNPPDNQHPHDQQSTVANDSTLNNKVASNRNSQNTDDKGFVGDLFDDFYPEIEQITAESVITAADKTDYSTNSKDNGSGSVLHYDDQKQMQVASLPIPCFQQLMQISGDLAHIITTIQQLPPSESIWLEVIYNGDEVVSDLREQIQTLIENTAFEVLKIKNTNVYNKILKAESSSETLQDLNEQQVFQRCLNVYQIAESQRPALVDAYSQLLYEIHNEDKMAE